MDSETEQMPLEEAVEILMERLPVPVQNFLKGEERNKVIYEISQKYRLHTDQAGDFERAALFMLLGIFSPEEFLANLRESGIPEQVAQGLAREVNEKIFIPLRKAEQSTPTAEATPTPAPIATNTATQTPPEPPIQQNQYREPLPPQGWNPQYPPQGFQPTFYGGQAQTYWIPVSISPIQHPMAPFPQYRETAPIPTPDVQAPPPTIREAPQVKEEYTERYTPEPITPMPDIPQNDSPVPPPPTPLKKEYNADPYREPPL